MLHIHWKLSFREVKWLFQGPKTEPKFDSRSDDKAFARRNSFITWSLILWLGPCPNTNTLKETRDNSEYCGFLRALLHMPIDCTGQAEIPGTIMCMQMKSKLALLLFLPLNIRLLIKRGSCSNLCSLPYLHSNGLLWKGIGGGEGN